MGVVRDPQTFIGFRKGRFVVTSFEGRENISGRMLFKCKCDCGKEFISRQNNLNRNTNSCGCFRKESIRARDSKNPQHVISTIILSNARRTMKEKKLKCSIKVSDVQDLIFQNCHYCGSEPSIPRKGWQKTTGAIILTNGIDRKNNSIGYIKENCLPCCTRCNYMKREMNYEEFLTYIGKIFKRLL